jgi:hypothetical protein
VTEQPDEQVDFPAPPEGLVKPDENSVVAFIDQPDQVETAMEQLVQEGFDREGVWVLCGPKGAARLDVYGKHHGLRGRVYRLLEWMSDEKGILFRARDHLDAGGLIMSVRADEEQKATAARVLGAHGGHGMAHFGRNHWEPLGTGTDS